ncbi:MAG: hypothetical protein U1E76_16140 [Planctomycetota bacterium]
MDHPVLKEIHETGFSELPLLHAISLKILKLLLERLEQTRDAIDSLVRDQASNDFSNEGANERSRPEPSFDEYGDDIGSVGPVWHEAPCCVRRF